MSLHRTLAPFGTAVLLSLVLAGCGGDALTAKEFRTQANKICKAADKDTDKLGEDLGDDPSEEALLKQIDKLVDRRQKMVDDIADLNAPDALVDDVDKMLKAVGKALDKIGDADYAELNSMENPFTDVDKQADELGLDECTSS